MELKNFLCADAGFETDAKAFLNEASTNSMETTASYNVRTPWTPTKQPNKYRDAIDARSCSGREMSWVGPLTYDIRILWEEEKVAQKLLLSWFWKRHKHEQLVLIEI